MFGIKQKRGKKTTREHYFWMLIQNTHQIQFIRGRIYINMNRHTIHKFIFVLLRKSNKSGSKKREKKTRHSKTLLASVNLFEGNSVFCYSICSNERIHKRRFIRFGACVVFFPLFVLFEQRIAILVYKFAQTPIQIGIRIGYTVENDRSTSSSREKNIRNRNQFTSELIQHHWCGVKVSSFEKCIAQKQRTHTQKIAWFSILWRW